MDFEEAAEWVAEKYLTQSRLTRLDKPQSKAKFVCFYWTFALFGFDDTDQHVYGIQVTRTWFSNKVLFDRIRVGAAMPLLAETAPKLHDVIWPFIFSPKHAHLIEKQAARGRKIMTSSEAWILYADLVPDSWTLA